jgi:hypothetical protein
MRPIMALKRSAARARNAVRSGVSADVIGKDTEVTVTSLRAEETVVHDDNGNEFDGAGRCDASNDVLSCARSVVTGWS